MKFNDALNEVNIQYVDYDFHKSFYDFVIQGHKMYMTEYKYKKTIVNKNGNPVSSIKVLPIYSSNKDHPMERGDSRLGINEEQLDALLLSAMKKIDNNGLFNENGYLIYQKSTGAVIPTLLYKNTDTLIFNDGQKKVLIKGNYYAPQSFTDHPDYFLEVRTVLNKKIHKYGTDQIKIYSSPATDTIGILKNHVDVLLENKKKTFIVVEIP